MLTADGGAYVPTMPCDDCGAPIGADCAMTCTSDSATRYGDVVSVPDPVRSLTRDVAHPRTTYARAARTITLRACHLAAVEAFARVHGHDPVGVDDRACAEIAADVVDTVLRRMLKAGDA